jgi:hypothetical protein
VQDITMPQPRDYVTSEFRDRHYGVM